MGPVRMGAVARRVEIYLVNLDRKTRPCVAISPDEMNKHVQTAIIAPMTTKGRSYPTRIQCTFQGKTGQVVLDQFRAVDRVRLVKRLARLTERQSKSVLA